MAKQKGETVPQAMRATYDAIVSLTDAVCKEHLNQEYADLARRLAAALARKRPSPIAQGKPASWACGIVYVLGMVNFCGTNRRRRTCAPTSCANCSASVRRRAARKAKSSAICLG